MTDSLRDTQPDLTLERSRDLRSERLIEYLRAYAHEVRDDGEPQRALFRQMMWGGGSDFPLCDLPLMLRTVAVAVEQPDLDLTVTRMVLWTKHDRLQLGEVKERLERLRFSASGTCSKL